MDYAHDHRAVAECRIFGILVENGCGGLVQNGRTGLIYGGWWRALVELQAGSG